MYKNQRILALITARGGSKGIPGKNIKSLGGKPLIQWTIDAAKQSRYIDRLILSSDDHEIIKVARSCQCDVPFIRPSELAQDASSSMDVIMHALDHMEQIEKAKYSHLLLLQPTSPFRETKHIDQIIEQCINQSSEMMISVNRLKKHPSYMYYLENGYLTSFKPIKKQLRRQDMPISYEHNGALYFSTINLLRDVLSYNCSSAMPYEMSRFSSLDLDEFEDWDYAEHLINTKFKS
ncbi:MAG: acylneuraminate cytidylyltransferase family protein [Paraglaciecola sp.]|uniref:acylneuraminate cytidylyltransferase family protein n=1 Tax=Paraglaciecola sp. TaxID=1920173 RepID=UPI0032655CF5